MASRNGTTYPIKVYLPPGAAVDKATMPVIYLLDGDSRFNAATSVVQASRARAIVVAIGMESLRARDYVPQNSCTPGGGGHAAFLDFICSELIPFVETTIGGDPARRTLLGHSHGGSFVLYALFAEANATRHFKAYLASDSSIACMPATVYGWESTFAAASEALPVRLHLSYAANTESAPFSQQLQSRRYTGLTLATQSYAGGHLGMIPSAFSDAIAFALA